jgi:hypothetical protein
MDIQSAKHIRSLHKPAVLLIYVMILCTIRASPLHSTESNICTHLDHLIVIPEIQLPGQDIKCICIIYPRPTNCSVSLYLLTAEEKTEQNIMDFDEIGKYTCIIQFEEIGRYGYWIEVTDNGRLILTSPTKYFWISISRDDRDSDGMPDSWETSQKFNPEDPTDAEKDNDADGHTNLKEYLLGTNPLDNNFFENTIHRLRIDARVVMISFIQFLVLIIISLIGVRSVKTWV